MRLGAPERCRMFRRAAAAVAMVALTIAAGVAVGNFGGAVGAIALEWLERFLGAPEDKSWPEWTRNAYGRAALLWLLATGLLFWVVTRARRRLVPLRAALRRSARDPGRKAVIMGLSYAELVVNAQGGFDETTAPMLAKLIDIGFKRASLPVAELDADTDLTFTFTDQDGIQTEKKAGAHTYVQNLRALRDHVLAGTLKVIVVVPSDKTKAQLPQFKAFLEEMLQGSGIMKDCIVEVADAPNYNAFEQTRDALEEARELAIRTFRKHHRGTLEDREICIDATSGTAAFSIAAGIVTLNHDMVYSYVTTLERGKPPRGGEPRYFDATVDLGMFIPDS